MKFVVILAILLTGVNADKPIESPYTTQVILGLILFTWPFLIFPAVWYIIGMGDYENDTFRQFTNDKSNCVLAINLIITIIYAIFILAIPDYYMPKNVEQSPFLYIILVTPFVLVFCMYQVYKYCLIIYERAREAEYAEYAERYRLRTVQTAIQNTVIDK